jgi:CRISPR/Cas system CSM-associated protein Csm3 (group 7 of RAMP superfamily)
MYSKDGEIKNYTTKDGLLSDEIRCCIPKEDGSILCGTNGGLAVIRNGKVERTVGIEDGVKNTVFLTVALGDDGEIYAGSDGDGIYKITENEVINIGRDDGLTSDVIMRIKKDDINDVYWIITSNSIEYMKNGVIKEVTTFPYNNNYDLYFNDDNDMWILSSYGIYVVDTNEMISDNVTDYKLYTIENGLTDAPSSNSYSELDEDGFLYIPVRTGVCKVNVNKMHEERAKVKTSISSIYCGNERIYADQDGVFTIPNKAGRIRITDGLFVGTGKGVKLELRPRIHIDAVTGTCASAKGKGRDEASGQKFETQYVGVGNEMEFCVYLYSEQLPYEAGAEGDGKKTVIIEQERIEQVFSQIHGSKGGVGSRVQFGGQKSNGCGVMELVSLRHHAFDMTDSKDRDAWAEEDKKPIDFYEDRLSSLPPADIYHAEAYMILLEGCTEGSLIVKSIALTDAAEKHDPDYVNMKNTEGLYIIPGSSVKGAVRAQFDRIASYLNGNQDGFDKQSVMEGAFGRAGEKKDTGSAGNVRFYDVPVGERVGSNMDVTYNRIRIDRFTGGVMNGSLFKEQTVHGKLRIEAAVMRTANDKANRRADKSCGMLILALRDLALGMYNLGSGYSVGRGFIRADKMTIRRADGKEAIFTFRHHSGEAHPEVQLEDPDMLVETCLKSLVMMDDTDSHLDSSSKVGYKATQNTAEDEAFGNPVDKRVVMYGKE